MKQVISLTTIILLAWGASYAQTATNNNKPAKKQLYMDVHYIGSKVKFKDVAAAHKKDLAIQKNYGVSFLKYWVDENNGIVYCLSSTADTANIRKVHQHAHGLLPHDIIPVTSGFAASAQKGKPFFMDIHQLGKVKADDVAFAHEKDLAAQNKYGVSFINYWVNEKNGVIFCLSQASDSSKVINTHRDAHGLLPTSIARVKQGQ